MGDGGNYTPTLQITLSCKHACTQKKTRSVLNQLKTFISLSKSKIESKETSPTSTFKEFVLNKLSLTSIKSEQYNKARPNESDLLRGTQGGCFSPSNKKEWVNYEWPVSSWETTVSSLLLEWHEGRCSFTLGLILCSVFFLGDRYPTHLAGVQRCHYSDVVSNQDNTIMGILSSWVCRWTATHAHVARDQQQQQQQKPNLKEIIRKEAKWHKQRKGANISVLRLHTIGQAIFMQQKYTKRLVSGFILLIYRCLQKYTKHLVSGFVQLIYQYLCSRSTGPPPTWVSQGATMAVRSLASEE